MSESLVFNKVPLEKIEAGMSVSYSQTVTDADIKAFAGLSGDRNPVHLNKNYASSSRFKKRIAHGMMTASYFSALFGTKIPGEGCVYTYQSLNFKRPVYLDDTVEAIATVTDVDLEKRRLRFKTSCKVDNRIVTDGEAELYVPIEFNKTLITDKNKLIKYKEQILELFGKTFDSQMNQELWEWAYIDNPNGDPIVSLYFDGKKLIGHHAVIPVLFQYNKKALKAVLSMTTMVEAPYRKHGIFIEQAEEVYKKAKELGYKFVCGFPNKKSAPGFKKRLGWNLEEDLYVAKFTYTDLQQIKKKTYSDSISFNTQDERNLEWRLNKPSQNYCKKDKNIFKKFGDDFDIVFSGIDFSNLEENKKYNLLLDHELSKHTDKKQFNYIFGYRLFDLSLEDVEFKKDLIISDVF